MQNTLKIFVVLCIATSLFYACHDSGPDPMNMDPDPMDTMPHDTMMMDTTFLDTLLGNYIGNCYYVDAHYDFPSSTYMYSYDTMLHSVLTITSIDKLASVYRINMIGHFFNQFYVLFQKFEGDTIPLSEVMSYRIEDYTIYRNEHKMTKYVKTLDQASPSYSLWTGVFHKE